MDAPHHMTSRPTVDPTAPEMMRRTRVGVGLAVAVIAAWAVLHLLAVFTFPVAADSALVAIAAVAVLSWLTVGLFIIAHDAIHGSLAPGRPGVNAFFGWLTMSLYAGFHYRRFEAAHHAHHDHSGTEGDPDFDAAHPRQFWPWYWTFMTRHFSWRPFLVINAVVWTYYLVFGASIPNILVYYATPAILSSLQLFFFGTYLPHRHANAAGGDAFPDRHRTRTTDFGFIGSLFSCYHFGYHHEHHLFPYEPWWRLPARRRDRVRELPATQSGAA